MGIYEDVFKKVIAHCKEYGYVFQSSEIYDGLAAAYDYGPFGVELKNNIKKVDVLEFPELGMEAVWKIHVENFPAFVVVDDKGHNFFLKWTG